MSLAYVFVGRVFENDQPGDDATTVDVWADVGSSGCQLINNAALVTAETCAYCDEEYTDGDLSHGVYAAAIGGTLPCLFSQNHSKVNARVIEAAGYYDTQTNIAVSGQYYTAAIK